MTTTLSRLIHNAHTALLCMLVLICSISVSAQTVSAGADNMVVQAQHWLDENLSREVGATTTLPLRLQVTVGELDRNLNLASCERVEPYVPVGTRLWGKTRLGLRCVQGVSKWNVFLPITVKAFGQAWAIKGHVASGAVLSASDAMQTEVDWAELSSPVVAIQADWVGRTATRMLKTGQTLRQDMVKLTQVFQAGAQIRVLGRGVGFEIATSGQAVSAGVLGESAKVRVDNGRTVNGMVVDDRTVRIDL